MIPLMPMNCEFNKTGYFWLQKNRSLAKNFDSNVEFFANLPKTRLLLYQEMQKFSIFLPAASFAEVFFWFFFISLQAPQKENVFQEIRPKDRNFLGGFE